MEGRAAQCFSGPGYQTGLLMNKQQSIGLFLDPHALIALQRLLQGSLLSTPQGLSRCYITCCPDAGKVHLTLAAVSTTQKQAGTILQGTTTKRTAEHPAMASTSCRDQH